MSPEDIKKLLGGYATDTLTTEERQALFAAALEDQELFDALAREQSLRDLLRDPAAGRSAGDGLSHGPGSGDPRRKDSHAGHLLGPDAPLRWETAHRTRPGAAERPDGFRHAPARLRRRDGPVPRGGGLVVFLVAKVRSGRDRRRVKDWDLDGPESRDGLVRSGA